MLRGAEAHIVQVDPGFARVVEAAGPFAPRPSEGTSFDALVRAIVYQQLAGRAAQTIHGRFLALYEGRATAEAVLQTPLEDLRAVGLSGSRRPRSWTWRRRARTGRCPWSGSRTSRTPRSWSA